MTRTPWFLVRGLRCVVLMRHRIPPPVDQAERLDQPGDLEALLKSPEWRFSHNWREIDPVKAALPNAHGSWIPARPNDHLEVPIKLLSRKLGDPNFLRPARDSPLARGGVGMTDSSLPAYVGAVPAEGVEPWDWDKTWALLIR